MAAGSGEFGRIARVRLLMLFAAAVPAATMLFVPPVSQDPGYHAFADRRMLLGVPNFWNVATNLPFLAVGIIGLWQVLSRRARGMVPGLTGAYAVFFAGVALVGFGSAAYHLDPRNATLVWDRLPMSISFAGFFCIVLGERISVRAGRRLLLPLIAIGILTVLYWAWTEQAGRGDLRPYAVAQFLPAMLIPLILLGWPSRFEHDAAPWLALACYLLAKFAEALDAPIYALTGAISGHAVKHLLAAAGALVFCLALERRRLRSHHEQAATDH